MDIEDYGTWIDISCISLSSSTWAHIYIRSDNFTPNNIRRKIPKGYVAYGWHIRAHGVAIKQSRQMIYKIAAKAWGEYKEGCSD